MARSRLPCNGACCHPDSDVALKRTLVGQNPPDLAKTHRVIAIDPLGTGHSDKPIIDYKMNTWTDSFAEFLRARRCDPATPPAGCRRSTHHFAS